MYKLTAINNFSCLIHEDYPNDKIYAPLSFNKYIISSLSSKLVFLDLPFGFNQKTTSIINEKGYVESTYGEDLGSIPIELGVIGRQHRVDNKFIREKIGFQNYIKLVCRYYDLIDVNSFINDENSLLKLKDLFYPCRFTIEPIHSRLKLIKVKFTDTDKTKDYIGVFNLNLHSHKSRVLKIDLFSDKAIENYQGLNYKVRHKIFN